MKATVKTTENGIHLKWSGFSQTEWESHMSKIPRSNSFHDWDFADIYAASLGMKIERGLILRKDKVIGIVQIYIMKHLNIFTTRKTIRGPLFLSPPMPDELESCLKQIKSQSKIWKGQMSHMMLELPDSTAITNGLGKMGLNKIMTGYSSIWIDLRQNIDDLRKAMHSKWRNQLSKSETLPFDLKENDTEGLKWLIEQSDRFQTDKGFTAVRPQLYAKLPAPKKLCLSASFEGQIVASLFCQLHGQSATYQMSYASEIGKTNNAMNFLLWSLILRLKEIGINHLDLGGIDRDKNPSLARFKERMGGNSFTLTGTYI